MEDSVFSDVRSIQELLREVEKHHSIRDGLELSENGPLGQETVAYHDRTNDHSVTASDASTMLSENVSNMTSSVSLQYSVASPDPQPLYVMREQLKHIASCTKRDESLQSKSAPVGSTGTSGLVNQNEAQPQNTSEGPLSQAFMEQQREAGSFLDALDPDRGNPTKSSPSDSTLSTAASSLPSVHLSQPSNASHCVKPSPFILGLSIADAQPVAVEATYPLPWYLPFASQGACGGTFGRSEDPTIGNEAASPVQQYQAVFRATHLSHGTAVVPGLHNNESLFSDGGINSLSHATAQKQTATVASFPKILYRLLANVEAAGKEHIISFMPSGKSVKIHDQIAFMKEIAPYYFKHKRISSLKRQLNKYGFELIHDGPEEGSYHHKYFEKGRDDVLNRVRRIR